MVLKEAAVQKARPALLIPRYWQYMNEQQLNHTFAALADPTRRAILARLADGEITVNELAEPFHISKPAIT